MRRRVAAFRARTCPRISKSVILVSLVVPRLRRQGGSGFAAFAAKTLGLLQAVALPLALPFTAGRGPPKKKVEIAKRTQFSLQVTVVKIEAMKKISILRLASLINYARRGSVVSNQVQPFCPLALCGLCASVANRILGNYNLS